MKFAAGFLLLMSFGGANAFCFDEAGQEFNVNPRLLRAIAEVESNMNPVAMNRDHLERTNTVDIGLMQINSAALRRLGKEGITQQALLENPCLNVRVGARILAEKYKKEGPSWEAVGAYNASCKQLKGDDCDRARSAYVKKVWAALKRQSPIAAQNEFAGNAPSKKGWSRLDKGSRIESIEIAISAPEANTQ